MARTPAGAGIIFMDGDEMLILKRSNRVSSPQTWAPPGGEQEPGESALTTAIREADEEILNLPRRYVITGEYQFKNPAMDYTLFVAHLQRRFTPRLNWEHSDYAWVTMKDLDKFRLHPGFRRGMKQIKELENAVS